MQPILSSITRTLVAVAALAVPLIVAQPASAAFWFPDQASVWGEQVSYLYSMLMWMSIAILVVVEVGLVYAIVKFRKRQNETRTAETWNHNTALEVAWTVIPFAMLIAILFPTLKAVAYLADVPKKPELTLEVIGHQFYWEYRYPELGVQFNTTPTMGPGTGMEELYVPVGRKMKVMLTASDVVHSWYIPNFGFQQMTTPGNLVMAPLEVTKPGLFEGYCTYLCGTLHGAMRTKIRAVSPEEFDVWVAKQTKKPELASIKQVGKIDMVAPPPVKPQHGAEGASTHATEVAHEAPVDAKALALKGKEVYASKCAGCHGATGAGIPGVFPPLASSDYVNASDEQLIHAIKKGLNGSITVNGAAYNGMMPAFAGQLSDEEIAAVATHIRVDMGNNGQAISPAAVKAIP